MSDATTNLLTKIILDTATLADFEAVSREYEGILDFFSTSAAENGSAANVLLDWGIEINIFSSSGIYIHDVGIRDFLNSRYRIYREGFRESGYYVRFPDKHTEQIKSPS